MSQGWWNVRVRALDCHPKTILSVLGKSFCVMTDPQVVSSENRHCWGTIEYIYGWKKRGNTTSLVTYISIWLSLWFEFHINEEGMKSMLDHIDKRRILMALALNWCLQTIMQYVLDMQPLALNEEWENALIFNIFFESKKMSDYSVWHLRECKVHQ